MEAGGQTVIVDPAQEVSTGTVFPQPNLILPDRYSRRPSPAPALIAKVRKPGTGTQIIAPSPLSPKPLRTRP